MPGCWDHAGSLESLSLILGTIRAPALWSMIVTFHHRASDNFELIAELAVHHEPLFVIPAKPELDPRRVDARPVAAVHAKALVPLILDPSCDRMLAV